jgi:hypothetical protein
MHASPEDWLNILECIAYICGLEHSSYPPCVCPVTGDLVRSIADRATPAQRQTLVKFIVPLSISGANREITHKRLFYCVDYIVRQMTPAALTHLGLIREAMELEDLPTIEDVTSAEEARDALRRLFLNAFIDPDKVKISMTLSELEKAAHTASKVLDSDGDALSVLRALRAIAVRLDKAADPSLSNVLFEYKRQLIENMLAIGPSLPVQAEVVRLRQQRLAQLDRKMARGQFNGNNQQ